MSTAVLSKAKFDVYRAITDIIIRAIEARAGEFSMPWHSCDRPLRIPRNAFTGRAYRDVNVIGLWAQVRLCGYNSGTWASFRQWQRLGADVRRGVRGTATVFYRDLHAGDPAARLEDDERGPLAVARASWVFHASQVEGWVPATGTRCRPIATPDSVSSSVEAFVAATKAEIRYGGETPRYRAHDDVIEMPDRGRFVGFPPDARHAMLLQELVRWARARHRLGRAFGGQLPEDACALEELVVELGGAFLCAGLGISNPPRPDGAAYVASWVKILRDDQRAIFSAARHASSAAEYLAHFNASS